MNALVTANIIEKTAVREALNAVISADVIEASAARRARTARVGPILPPAPRMRSGPSSVPMNSG